MEQEAGESITLTTSPKKSSSAYVESKSGCGVGKAVMNSKIARSDQSTVQGPRGGDFVVVVTSIRVRLASKEVSRSRRMVSRLVLAFFYD